MVDILVPIAMFAAAFGIVFIALTTRNKERMAMIEKGMNPHEGQPERKRSGLGALRWGMLIVGVGLGLFIGNALEPSVGHLAIPGMVCICGGTMLAAYYFIARKMKNGNNNDSTTMQ